ncbi:aldo/keto reductase [Dysosmobacter sp.]|uniref:aldo/keto reductase n=1 Tax=Dysosmobacter sp. TaxID=2591382 RepID=UPI002A8D65F7|nr:aldo/keto reductase [Dysosmobacter sp.]MDY3281380.1 aldo/keto reductase [Dysosmobacter sp.]
MASILEERKVLNNGVEMPMMGFGTWQMTNESAAVAVRQAIEAGYRLIDTAAFYNVEEGVGQGIRDSGIPREELFVTTKVWPTMIYQDRVEEALEGSLKRLGLDYVDMCLLHWPVNYVEGWKKMEQLYKAGRVRAIGVSNMRVKQLMTLMDNTEIIPAFIQIECNPLVSQYEIRALCEYKGIAVGGWQSLGSGAQGGVLNNEIIMAIAEKHGKSTAQVALRWAYQNGVITVPKTVTPARMAQNADIMDFALTPEDMAQIGSLPQLPRYDTEIADVPVRIMEQVKRGVCFAEKGYAGNLTVDFYKDK